MSSRGKRKNAPKKFVDKPGIPDDDTESDDSVREGSLSSENEEDDAYKSNEDNSSSSSSSSSEEEEKEDLKKKTKTNSKVKQESPKTRGMKKSVTSSENGERTFKILLESIIPENGTPEPNEKLLKSNGGKFTGKNPGQAGKKAFNRLCRSAMYEEECEIGKNPKKVQKGSFIYIYNIQETTPNSAQKIFPYRGERLRLEEPRLVLRENVEYFVYYSSSVKSYKKVSENVFSSKNTQEKNSPAKKLESSSKNTQEKNSPSKKLESSSKNTQEKNSPSKKLESSSKNTQEKNSPSKKLESSSKNTQEKNSPVKKSESTKKTKEVKTEEEPEKKSAPRGRKSQQKAKV